VPVSSERQRGGNRRAGHRAQTVRVLALSAGATRGFVALGPLRFLCALGRSGCKALKREGDGATPIGRWRIGSVRYRPDRAHRPRSACPARAMAPSEGWCDAPADRNYNRLVHHPYPASAERLWRQDGLYDLLAVLAYNERPRVRGRGSAIFMHVARAGYAPTEGCVALRREHLARLVERLRPGAVLEIGAANKKRPARVRRALRSTYRGSGVLE
jgi:L,D-peptidoglycan transpeptidase YkuD (ErfK/YbiS/YcfS/YnhG family)